MSVKLMGAVFDLDIPRDPKFVLLAMADPAADDGSNSYLAVETIAKKTSMSPRGVQQIIRRLLFADYVEFVGKVHVHTKRRVAALKGETVLDFRKRDGFGQGFTAEYRLTLDRGVKENLISDNPARDAPFGSQRTLHMDAEDPARHDTRTPHGEAKEARTPCGGIKDLSVKEEPKEEAEESTAAPSEHVLAFRALGYDVPFGPARFQQIWTEEYSAVGAEPNWTDTMERVIQRCVGEKVKIPPVFYSHKRAIEQGEVRERYHKVPL